jgi:hypothetical protein
MPDIRYDLRERLIASTVTQMWDDSLPQAQNYPIYIHADRQKI